MRVRSLGREDPLVEGMATDSSILAWNIPWAEEPGGLQSMGLQRDGHGRAIKHRYTKGHCSLSLWNGENQWFICQGYCEPVVEHSLEKN